MSRPRPPVLRIGDRVEFGGLSQTVTGFAGTLVRLADEHGATSVVHLPHMLADPSFRRLGEHQSSPLLPAGFLNAVPRDEIERAEWWSQHIVEVITGRSTGADEQARPRPQYDPATRTLTQREQAKAAELTELTGVKISEHTVKRKRRRHQARGIAGLVDWRAAPAAPARGRVDARVVKALEQAIGEATDKSTRTASYFYWRIQQILVAEHGPSAVPLPSRATFYRLFDRISTGQHVTGSARTRRSLANQPDTPFSALTACRSGELVQIDSTPLDVLVLVDDGVPGRVDLTAMVDVATRTIPAAVLRPTTKSVDAALLLARAVVPEPMRPGWAQALEMSRSVLPHRRLLALDQRLEHAAARPVIVPETIVSDQGKVFISDNFRAACASLGINFQPAHPGTPTDKPQVERQLESVGTLFSQFVSGYLGRSAEYRGRKVEDEPLWPLAELQELLDEWIVAVWQNRPHDGLRDPVAPGRAFTPNEKYAALVESAGYIPVALSADDYIEMLPATWRAINAYGVKISCRVYDDEKLNDFRRQPSGVKARNNRWEVHRDPYDVSRIWVRNHWSDGWITVFWKHLNSAPAPFGEMAWDHVRQDLAARGLRPSEAEIAQAAADLLSRASGGPGLSAAKSSKRDRRVAARTKATSKPAWPRPEQPAPPGDDVPGVSQPPLSDGLAADVVPLPVFDAREEARTWW